MELFADAANGGPSWDSLKVILPCLITLVMGGGAWCFRLERLLSRSTLQHEIAEKWTTATREEIERWRESHEIVTRRLYDSAKKKAEQAADRVGHLEVRIAVVESRIDGIGGGGAPRRPPRS